MAVCFLDLVAGKLLFDAEIKANQTEHNADWLAVFICGLDGERVDDVLQDKSRTAHGVDVYLVVGGAHCILFKHSLAKEVGRMTRYGASSEQVSGMSYYWQWSQ
jgi:hypothetical protein